MDLLRFMQLVGQRRRDLPRTLGIRIGLLPILPATVRIAQHALALAAANASLVRLTINIGAPCVILRPSCRSVVVVSMWQRCRGPAVATPPGPAPIVALLDPYPG